MSTHHTMLDLSAFQRDVLAVTAALEAPIGRDILDELGDHYGRSINSGQLYPNLSALVEAGLVEIDEKSGRANYYEVTDAGEDAIEAHIEWLDTLATEGDAGATPA